MNDNLQQIEDINISYFDMALCNGTIEKELEKLTNRQLGYLKLLISEDENNDLSILDEYIDNELLNRQSKNAMSLTNENNFVTVRALEEKIVSSMLIQLEQFEYSDTIRDQIREINTHTLRTIERYMKSTLVQEDSKRQMIFDFVQAELNERNEQEKDKQKKLSL
jgi:hypothetical protein